VGAQPPINFEHLVQQFYVSAMIQMGAAHRKASVENRHSGARTPLICWACCGEDRATLHAAEDKTLQTVLFEVRMAFLELTSMITLQGMQPPQPPRQALKKLQSGVITAGVYGRSTQFLGTEPRWEFPRWAAAALFAPRPTRATGA